MNNSRVMHQYSTIVSLGVGNFNGSFAVSEVIKNADFGIGTFDKLDGEMIVLEGKAYQMLSDGTIKIVDCAKMTTPYASLCQFVSDKTIKVEDSMLNKAQVENLLNEQLGSANLFYAIKITGMFKEISTRTVSKQSEPYVRLVQAAAGQSTYRMTNEQGTIVGFFTPGFANRIGVAGFHLHFINDGKTSGGHVFDFSLSQAKVEWMMLDRIDLHLPSTDQSYCHNSQNDMRLLSEIQQAEASDK